MLEMLQAARASDRPEWLGFLSGGAEFLRMWNELLSIQTPDRVDEFARGFLREIRYMNGCTAFAEHCLGFWFHIFVL